jgi:putative transposase
MYAAVWVNREQREIIEYLKTENRVLREKLGKKPDAAWMQQMGRNLTDCYDGFLNDVKYILLDRDTKFLPFKGVLDCSETKVVLLPPKSPNLNAQTERYMPTLKSECLNKMIFFGEKSLRRALTEFVDHYHRERNHQGLGNTLIEPEPKHLHSTGEIACRNRLGGMLWYYDREAA